jgi:hypothetical protein
MVRLGFGGVRGRRAGSGGGEEAAGEASERGEPESRGYGLEPGLLTFYTWRRLGS